MCYLVVGKQTEKEVGIGVCVFLMMDGAQREVGFQLAVGCFYFPYQVVIIPGRFFIERGDIGTQEVSAVFDLHVFYGDFESRFLFPVLKLGLFSVS